MRIPPRFFVAGTLAAASDDAKLLAGHLWTGEHATVIGCFRRPTAYLAADLGWSEKRTRAALDTLVALEFIVRDKVTGWTLIPSFVETNPIHNGNAGVAAVTLFAEIPSSSPIIGRVIEALRPFRARLKPAVDARKARASTQRAADLSREPAVDMARVGAPPHGHGIGGQAVRDFVSARSENAVDQPVELTRVSEEINPGAIEAWEERFQYAIETRCWSISWGPPPPMTGHRVPPEIVQNCKRLIDQMPDELRPV